MPTNDTIKFKHHDAPTMSIMLSARKIGENLQIEFSEASAFLF